MSNYYRAGNEDFGDNTEVTDKKYGVVYVNVSLYLDIDLDEEEIEGIISEMDYNFKHKYISETRINGYEVNDEENQ